ncbi:uncharacterized protein LOC132299241 isoform X1 [Cornus florida]|uniref:uncharacterized protein LOC132299241 isoform X1 n=1 Tax=Cornus florida TaxID=4283 RepID=UPI00289F30BE|nr:uncharacterized protein LOC132299241 isoform X1 [Cornus florida]
MPRASLPSHVAFQLQLSRQKMSSSLEIHCLAAETLGSAVKVEFGEVAAILDVPNALSDCQALPFKYIQPLSHVTTTSSRVSAYLIDGHSTVSILNQGDEELLTDAIYHNSESSIFKEPETFRKTISSCSQGEDYIGKMKDF